MCIQGLQFSQLELIESFNKIIYSDLDIIETLEGVALDVRLKFLREK